MKPKLQNPLLFLNLYSIICILLISQCQSSTCDITNSLTPGQSVALSEFTKATYITIDQQPSLRTAYQSLNRRLDNYLIQLDDSYLFDINDVDQCSDIPNYVTFDSMDNIWICLKNPVMVLECNKQWQFKIGCGTFIELHRPFDTEVLAEIMLSADMIKDVFSLTLLNLCSGTYHLWFVYSVRVGKIIKNVKPIFVSYPSCFCD